MADHRIERARERYGLKLTLADCAALEKQLGPANCLRRMPDGGSVHVLNHAGVTLVVAARPCTTVPGRLALCTFLPLDTFGRTTRAAGRAKHKHGKGGRLIGNARRKMLEQRHAGRE